MSRIAVATTASEIEPLRSLWEALYRPGFHTLFQSFEWNLLAARCLREESPYVVAVEDSGGAAIVPACTAAGCVSMLGDALFDYRDLLSGSDKAVTSAWECIARLNLALEVTAIRGDEARARWQGLGFETVPFVTAPAVRHCDVDAVEFEARHHRSVRLLRRLSRAGAEFRERPAESGLLRTIYEHKAAQVLETGPNLFTDPARRRFLIAAGERGGCDVFTYETAGTLVAALVTFRDDRVRRFYTIYHDGAWAPFSPGVALLFEATRRSLAAGLDCDYMTGEQPHKMRFATASTPLFRARASGAELASIGSAARLIAA